MKKTIKGYLFNRIEELGNKKYNHIGFEGEKTSFGDLMASLVPEVGMKKKAQLTIEILNNKASKKNGK